MNRILPLAVLAVIGASACKKQDAEDRPVPGTGTGTGSASGSAEARAPDAGKVAEAVVDAAPASDLLPHPFLWKAEKDGKAVYLLGTIHIGVEPARLPPLVWDRLAAAKAFAMEIDIASVNPMDLLKPRKDGKTVEEDLGPEHWKKLQDRLGPAVAQSMNGLESSLIAELLQVQLLPPTTPMELALIEKAKAAKLQMVYLEKAELQQALLEKWFDTRMLKEMLDNFDEMKEQSTELKAAYEAGDAARVEALSSDEEGWLESGRTQKELDQMNEDLLFGRNASWIPAIEKLAADGTDAFIAVGVAHLLGDKSVLDLLAKDGYTITRLEVPK